MSQKSKLNTEEKVEIIRKYQQGEISLVQAARWIFAISEKPSLSARTKVKGGAGIPIRGGQSGRNQQKI